MKILMLSDHYPLSPRVKKIRNSMLKLYPESNVKILAWNRENTTKTEDYVETFNQDLGYGNKLGKLLNLIKFKKKAKMLFDEFKPDYVHAIDLEMCIVARAISKKVKLIYEVYDIKFFENKILNYIREKLELNIIKNNISGMILASPYFKIYYDDKCASKKDKIIINNKPSNSIMSNKSKGYMSSYMDLLRDKIVIGFIGTIRYKDILLNLINSVKDNDKANILLSGSGPHLNIIKEYVEKNNLQNKVIMTGRYREADLEEIYDACDYIWAAYPNKDLNVKYAISNKFFESIVFNKKVIVSENTMLGDSVIELKKGYVVNPYAPKDIEALIEKLEINKYKLEKTSFGNGFFWEDEELELKKIYKL